VKSHIFRCEVCGADGCPNTNQMGYVHCYCETCAVEKGYCVECHYQLETDDEGLCSFCRLREEGATRMEERELRVGRYDFFDLELYD
jgi:hypothetical protein